MNNSNEEPEKSQLEIMGGKYEGKEKQLRALAKIVGKDLKLKGPNKESLEDLHTKPLSTISEVLKKVIPDPRKGKTLNVVDKEKGAKICKILAKGINEFEKREIIDLDVPIDAICEQIAEYIYTSIGKIDADLTFVKDDVSRILENLYFLDEVLSTNDQKLKEEAKSVIKDPRLSKQIEGIINARESISKEKERQLHLLSNLLDTIEPKQKSFKQLVKDLEGITRIVKKLKTDKPMDLSKKITYLLFGLNKLAYAQASIIHALKVLNISLNDYKKRSASELRSLINKKLLNAIPKHSDKLYNFIRAADLLYKYFPYRENIKGAGVFRNMEKKMKKTKIAHEKIAQVFADELNNKLESIKKAIFKIMEGMRKLERPDIEMYNEILEAVEYGGLNETNIKNYEIYNIIYNDKYVINYKLAKKQYEVLIEILNKYENKGYKFLNPLKKAYADLLEFIKEHYTKNKERFKEHMVEGDSQVIYTDYKGKYTISNIMEILGYYIRIEIFKIGIDDIKISEEDLEKYKESVGKGVAVKMESIMEEKKKSIKRISEIYEFCKNAANGITDADTRERIEHNIKFISKAFDANLEMYTALEALDLYLMEFTKAVRKDITKIKNIRKIISNVEIISSFEDINNNEDLGKMYVFNNLLHIWGDLGNSDANNVTLYPAEANMDYPTRYNSYLTNENDNFPHNILDENVHANANKNRLFSSLVYMKYSNENKKLPDTYTIRDHIGDSSDLSDDTLRTLYRSFYLKFPEENDNVFLTFNRYIKNLLSIFYSLSDSFKSISIENEVYMSAKKMYNIFKKFVFYSAFSYYNEEIADNALLIEKIHYVYNTTMPMVRVSNINNNHVIKDEDVAFFHCALNAMFTKIKLILDLEKTVYQPINTNALYIFNPSRLILGAKEEKFMKDYIELYIRMIFIINFYRKLFSIKNQVETIGISIMPNFNSRFNKLFILILQEGLEDGGDTNYFMSDLKYTNYIKILNELINTYKADGKSSNPKKIMKKIIYDFVGEINKHFGVYTESQRAKMKSFIDNLANKRISTESKVEYILKAINEYDDLDRYSMPHIKWLSSSSLARDEDEEEIEYNDIKFFDLAKVELMKKKLHEYTKDKGLSLGYENAQYSDIINIKNIKFLIESIKKKVEVIHSQDTILDEFKNSIKFILDNKYITLEDYLWYDLFYAPLQYTIYMLGFINLITDRTLLQDTEANMITSSVKTQELFLFFSNLKIDSIAGEVRTDGGVIVNGVFHGRVNFKKFYDELIKLLGTLSTSLPLLQTDKNKTGFNNKIKEIINSINNDAKRKEENKRIRFYFDNADNDLRPENTDSGIQFIDKVNAITTYINNVFADINKFGFCTELIEFVIEYINKHGITSHLINEIQNPNTLKPLVELSFDNSTETSVRFDHPDFVTLIGNLASNNADTVRQAVGELINSLRIYSKSMASYDKLSIVARLNIRQMYDKVLLLYDRKLIEFLSNPNINNDTYGITGNAGMTAKFQIEFLKELFDSIEDKIKKDSLNDISKNKQVINLSTYMILNKEYLRQLNLPLPVKDHKDFSKYYIQMLENAYGKLHGAKKNMIEKIIRKVYNFMDNNLKYFMMSFLIKDDTLMQDNGNAYQNRDNYVYNQRIFLVDDFLFDNLLKPHDTANDPNTRKTDVDVIVPVITKTSDNTTELMKLYFTDLFKVDDDKFQNQTIDKDMFIIQNFIDLGISPVNVNNLIKDSSFFNVFNYTIYNNLIDCDISKNIYCEYTFNNDDPLPFNFNQYKYTMVDPKEFLTYEERINLLNKIIKKYEISNKITSMNKFHYMDDKIDIHDDFKLNNILANADYTQANFDDENFMLFTEVFLSTLSLLFCDSNAPHAQHNKIIWKFIMQVYYTAYKGLLEQSITYITEKIIFEYIVEIFGLLYSKISSVPIGYYIKQPNVGIITLLNKIMTNYHTIDPRAKDAATFFDNLDKVNDAVKNLIAPTHVVAGATLLIGANLFGRDPADVGEVEPARHEASFFNILFIYMTKILFIDFTGISYEDYINNIEPSNVNDTYITTMRNEKHLQALHSLFKLNYYADKFNPIFMTIGNDNLDDDQWTPRINVIAAVDTKANITYFIDTLFSYNLIHLHFTSNYFCLYNNIGKELLIKTKENFKHSLVGYNTPIVDKYKIFADSILDKNKTLSLTNFYY